MAQAHTAHGDGGVHPVDAAHAHPSAWSYVRIFVLLFVVTALEVAVTTPIWPAREMTQLPSLLVLAVFKAAAIALFYMHLKYDSRAFAALFIVGMILAVSMLLTFLALFAAHYREPYDQSQRQATQQEGGAGAAGTTGAGGTTTGGTAARH